MKLPGKKFIPCKTQIAPKTISSMAKNVKTRFIYYRKPGLIVSRLNENGWPNAIFEVSR